MSDEKELQQGDGLKEPTKPKAVKKVTVQVKDATAHYVNKSLKIDLKGKQKQTVNDTEALRKLVKHGILKIIPA